LSGSALNSTQITDRLEAGGYTEDYSYEWAKYQILKKITASFDVNEAGYTEHELGELPEKARYAVSMNKEVLLKALSNFKTSVQQNTNYLANHMDVIAKDSAIGKVLKDANYLSGLMQMNDVNKLDHMYLSFRINLANEINIFNDKDKANNRSAVVSLFDSLSEEAWEYVYVYIKDDRVKAYLPNWNKIKDGNSRIAAAVLTECIQVETHVHIKKPSTFKKVFGVVFTIVLAVLSCLATVCTTIGWVLTIGTAVASSAAMLTGSKTWGKIGKFLAIYTVVTNITGAIGRQTLMTFVKQRVFGWIIQIIAEVNKHKTRSAMKEINAERKALTDEEHEVDVLITEQEALNKDIEYVSSLEFVDDQYSASYEYDEVFKTRIV